MLTFAVSAPRDSPLIAARVTEERQLNHDWAISIQFNMHAARCPVKLNKLNGSTRTISQNISRLIHNKNSLFRYIFHPYIPHIH